MSRALASDILVDRAGNVIGNATATVCTDSAATTLATDAYAASSGGSPVTTVTTDSAGRWTLYFDTPKSFWLKWTDNSNTAYSGTAANPVSFTTFVGPECQAFQKAEDEASDALTGTFAARPAAGTAGRRYRATWAGGAIQREYIDTGTAWIAVGDAPTVFNPLDYGADPTGATDSRAAVVACLAAATADLQTGLPYGSGTTHGEIEWTAGQYTISSSITLPTQIPLKMRGSGGSGGDFLNQQAVAIIFTTGGFILDNAQTNAVSWDGLTIMSNNGVCLFVDRGAGPGSMRNCELRSYTSGQPALKIRNAFWGDFQSVTFRAPDTSTPSVLIESDSITYTGGMEGWLFRWLWCKFDYAGVRWDIGANHSTIIGAATVFDGCDTENFSSSGTAGAMLHIRNTHATQSTTFETVEFRSCSHNDGGTDVLALTTLGSGLLIVQSASIIHTNPYTGATTYHVRHVETGGGAAHCDRIFIKGAGNPLILFGASSGGYGAMVQVSGSGWQYIGDRTTATAFSALVNGDTQSRITIDAQGLIKRGPGGSTAPDVVHATVTGTPEGATTSNIGGVAQRRDGAAGSALYLKETGTGNTGWVALPAISTLALLTANTFTAAQQVRPTASAAKALQLRASTTSPGNIQEWQDSSGTVLTKIAATGYIANNSDSCFWDFSNGQFKTTLAAPKSLEIVANASQTAALQNWLASNGTTVYSRVNKDGYFMTRKTAAPADADLATSEMALWLDDTAGAAKLMIKAKNASGTVVTGSVSLT